MQPASSHSSSISSSRLMAVGCDVYVVQLKAVVISVPLVLLSGIILCVVVVYCWLKNRSYVSLSVSVYLCLLLHLSLALSLHLQKLSLSEF